MASNAMNLKLLLEALYKIERKLYRVKQGLDKTIREVGEAMRLAHDNN